MRKKEYKFFVDRRGGCCWFFMLHGRIYSTGHIGAGRNRFIKKEIEKIFNKCLCAAMLNRRNEMIRGYRRRVW